MEVAPRIAKLPSHLINQIAAGEVIDRPSSVLKELAENSLDAGARRIELLLENGGIDSISVLDDGTGMELTDLKLCVERHATSKITSFEDLTRLASFGFRGEALSSIAAVSEVEIRSRTVETPHGYRLKVHYGKALGDPEKVASPVGTLVGVRHLFDETPARKKFLRSTNSELSNCLRVAKELALGNPPTAWGVSHHGKQVHIWNTPTREARVHEILKISDPLCFHQEAEGLHCEGFFARSAGWQDRADVYLFINGRGVRNRALLGAVRSAFDQALGPHHSPQGVVYLEIQKDWVDANSHPQKLEVRLARENVIYGWLLSELRKFLSENKVMRHMENLDPKVSSQNLFREEALGSRPTTEGLREPILSRIVVQEPDPNYRVRELPTTVQPAADPPVLQQAGFKFSDRKYLGQVNASYLLWEESDGMVFVDQHALHEKILFERLISQFENDTIASQTLLVPLIITIPLELQPQLPSSLPHFARMGFDIELFGGGDIAVKSCPDRLQEVRVRDVIVECLKALVSEGEVGDLNTLLRPMFSSVACHSAVRSGDRLSSSEVHALMEGLGMLKQGWTCPHGRPIIFRIPFTVLSKQFERR